LILKGNYTSGGTLPVDDPTRYAADLREFNNRIVDCKSEITTLEQNIDEYRGHCSKIEFHVNKIKSGNKLDYLFSIFGVASKAENEKLSEKLQDIYNEELNPQPLPYRKCSVRKPAKGTQSYS
jgi:predicted  nucleic acid-binding Zn-ribbon protein